MERTTERKTVSSQEVEEQRGNKGTEESGGCNGLRNP